MTTDELTQAVTDLQTQIAALQSAVTLLQSQMDYIRLHMVAHLPYA